MDKNTRKGIALARLAAALYALNAPFSKLLLDSMPPVLAAGFLYIGAGIGMALLALVRKISGRGGREMRLTSGEFGFTAAMIVLDIAAPICLLLGLRTTAAANASLLNNFEIVATALIALAAFGEKISARLWLGIASVTLSCAILSFDGAQSLRFSPGSALILLAAVCWGLENNCTRRISSFDPQQIVLLKGIFSGLGSVAIGFVSGERIGRAADIPFALALGLVAYGLSIYFYVYAQRSLGAARTSAYYAVAPFISALFSFVIFREYPGKAYFIALAFMALGAWLCSHDKTPRSDGLAE